MRTIFDFGAKYFPAYSSQPECVKCQDYKKMIVYAANSRCIRPLFRQVEIRL